MFVVLYVCACVGREGGREGEEGGATHTWRQGQLEGGMWLGELHINGAARRVIIKHEGPNDGPAVFCLGLSALPVGEDEGGACLFDC